MRMWSLLSLYFSFSKLDKSNGWIKSNKSNFLACSEKNNTARWALKLFDLFYLSNFQKKSIVWDICVTNRQLPSFLFTKFTMYVTAGYRNNVSTRYTNCVNQTVTHEMILSNTSLVQCASFVVKLQKEQEITLVFSAKTFSFWVTQRCHIYRNVILSN